jgi:hypothetical protein
MAITDPQAINFSNNVVRRAADHVAQSYNKAVTVSNRWSALGGGQGAIDIMSEDLRDIADLLYTTYLSCHSYEKLWFNGINTLIANDAEEDVVDGSPSDGRPDNNGASINGVMTLVIQFQNWMLSPTGSFTDGDRGSVAYLNTVINLIRRNKPEISTGDAGNFINRCNELIVNYEASTNVNLNKALALSVHPNREA